MKNKNWSSDQGITRRAALKGVSGALFATTISTGVVSGSSDTTELPGLISGGEVVEWITVPTAWYEQKEHAKRVLNEKRSELERKTGVIGAQLGQSPNTYDGKNGLQIEVLTNDSTQLDKSAIPSQVDGVEVAIEEQGSPQLGGCDAKYGTDNCVNINDDTYVKGGQNMVDWGAEKGSACIRIDDKNGNERMLTVAHLFWGNCDDANSQISTGETAATYDGDSNWTAVGEVDIYDINADYAFIKKDGRNATYSNKIDDEDFIPRVVGYVSYDLLDSWASESDPPCIRNAGPTTGKTGGRVKKVNANYAEPDCVDYDGNGVRTSCDIAEGDSGSPTYYMYYGNAYLISATSSYDPLVGPFYIDCPEYSDRSYGGGRSMGAAAYWIEAEQNVQNFGDGKYGER